MHPSQLLSVKNEILNSDLRVLEPATKKIARIFEPKAISEAVEKLRTL